MAFEQRSRTYKSNKNVWNLLKMLVLHVSRIISKLFKNKCDKIMQIMEKDTV